MSVDADFAVERFEKRQNQLKYHCLSRCQPRPPPPVPPHPPGSHLFQLNFTSLSWQMAVFSLIPRNWILMNSAMNNQARNYFPISSPDIPPSLCISGINT